MIIGLTGTLGAGKGTVIEYLTSKGWKHYSGGHTINAEVIRRGLPQTRESMSMVANDLRAKYGAGYFVEQMLQQINKDDSNVLESLHSVGEADAVRAAGGIVVAIDADMHFRYDRICKRKSTKDHVTFEQFKADNEREMSSSDPVQHNLMENINKADYKIINNGSIDDLHKQIDSILISLKK